MLCVGMWRQHCCPGKHTRRSCPSLMKRTVQTLIRIPPKVFWTLYQGISSCKCPDAVRYSALQISITQPQFVDGSHISLVPTKHTNPNPNPNPNPHPHPNLKHPLIAYKNINIQPISTDCTLLVFRGDTSLIGLVTSPNSTVISCSAASSL